MEISVLEYAAGQDLIQRVLKMFEGDEPFHTEAMAHNLNNRFVLSVHAGSSWDILKLPCKPTRKQRSRFIKEVVGKERARRLTTNFHCKGYN